MFPRSTVMRICNSTHNISEFNMLAKHNNNKNKQSKQHTLSSSLALSHLCLWLLLCLPLSLLFIFAFTFLPTLTAVLPDVFLTDLPHARARAMRWSWHQTAAAPPLVFTSSFLFSSFCRHCNALHPSDDVKAMNSRHPAAKTPPTNHTSHRFSTTKSVST